MQMNNLIKENWCSNDYQEFLNFLKDNSDLEYKKFHQSLVKDLDKFYGCRIPFLKKVAKEISIGNYQDFLKLNKLEYYEEKMIYGFIISGVKMDFNERLVLVKHFITVIDNWAICDSFCANLKCFKNNKELGFKFINKLIKTNDVYSIRVGLVLLLDYYIIPEYLDKIFKICNSIKNKDYYVLMAISWLISICYIKYPKITLEYLKNNKLDKWTHNKAIQKIKESRRITKEEKELLKEYIRS